MNIELSVPFRIRATAPEQEISSVLILFARSCDGRYTMLLNWLKLGGILKTYAPWFMIWGFPPMTNLHFSTEYSVIIYADFMQPNKFPWHDRLTETGLFKLTESANFNIYKPILLETETEY